VLGVLGLARRRRMGRVHEQPTEILTRERGQEKQVSRLCKMAGKTVLLATLEMTIRD
jgi:hypothetical protein